MDTTLGLKLEQRYSEKELYQYGGNKSSSQNDTNNKKENRTLLAEYRILMKKYEKLEKKCESLENENKELKSKIA